MSTLSMARPLLKCVTRDSRQLFLLLIGLAQSLQSCLRSMTLEFDPCLYFHFWASGTRHTPIPCDAYFPSSRPSCGTRPLTSPYSAWTATGPKFSCVSVWHRLRIATLRLSQIYSTNLSIESHEPSQCCLLWCLRTLVWLWMSWLLWCNLWLSRSALYVYCRRGTWSFSWRHLFGQFAA